jgi:hypothetical protein
MPCSSADSALPIGSPRTCTSSSPRWSSTPHRLRVDILDPSVRVAGNSRARRRLPTPPRRRASSRSTSASLTATSCSCSASTAMDRLRYGSPGRPTTALPTAVLPLGPPPATPAEGTCMSPSLRHAYCSSGPSPCATLPVHVSARMFSHLALALCSPLATRHTERLIYACSPESESYAPTCISHPFPLPFEDSTADLPRSAALGDPFLSHPCPHRC